MMSQGAKWSIVGAVVLTICILAGVPLMLRAVNQQQPAETETTASVQVAERPDCRGDFPVALPCLGAQHRDAEAQPTVVNLWAWWCEPCRSELPIVEAYAASHSDIRVIGVHADPNAANGAAMLNDLDIDLPSYQDDSGTFAGTLGLPAVVPVTVVLRADGSTAAVFPKVFESQQDLERSVEEALQ